MRGFTYELTLDGKGYQLSNGTGLSSLMRPDSAESIRNPGIQMSVENCEGEDLLKFCHGFSVHMSASRANDSFAEYKNVILLNRVKECKLVNVCVKNHMLVLGYIDLLLYKKFEEDVASGKIDQQTQEEYDCDSPTYFPPYYAWYVCRDGNFTKAELVFKTVDTYGVVRDHIHVYVSDDGTIELMELDKDKTRLFKFQNEAWDSDSTVTHITECIN